MDISPTEVRYAFQACVSTDDLQRVVDGITEDATTGVPIVNKDGEIEGYRRSAAAQKLWTAYVLGTPRKATALPPREGIEDIDLGTVDGCMQAAMEILRQQIAGAIDDDQAAALRATVDLAMKAHQIKSGERATDVLEEMGAQIVFGEAGRMEESLREIGAAMDKQKETTNAD